MEKLRFTLQCFSCAKVFQMSEDYKFTSIEAAAFKSTLEKHPGAAVIDVRDVDFGQDGGVLNGSMHVPVNTIDANPDTVLQFKDTPACFVYCRSSGGRAHRSAHAIQTAFPEKPVYLVKGGIRALVQTLPASEFTQHE